LNVEGEKFDKILGQFKDYKAADQTSGYVLEEKERSIDIVIRIDIVFF